MHSKSDVPPSLVPKASKVLTPAQYGATPPDGSKWPLNEASTERHRYAVNNIYPTIQGEGKHVGVPMTIVRLQGCPVGCVFCDTPESWEVSNAWHATADDIAAEVAGYPPRWALVTGGEPAWHDLDALTDAFARHGLKRALETSGVYPITGLWNWVTVSPKPRGLLPIHYDAVSMADEIKWLVGKESDVEALEEWLERWRRVPVNSGYVISLQPISCSRRATAIAVEALMKHADWRLSLQTHKMMGVA